MKKLTFLLLTFFISILTPTTQVKADETTEAKPSIIALAPHIVEMLYSIGAGDQIIGTTDFADYPEQAKKIPRIGNYVRLQLERVIELQPDLIIAWKSGNPSDDLARLSQLGFTVVYSQPNTFEDIASEIVHFGKLTGHEQQAQKLAKQFSTELTSIKKTYQDKKSITVFYELWSRPLTTIAKGSWPQQHLDICHATNPFKQVSTPYPQVNIEQVIQSPIDLIIQPLSKNQKDREGFNWQDWPLIPAVKNNHIIQPDADALHRMTLRSLGELKHLCEQIDLIRQTVQTK
jgi:vitamin B12 transport system substrate-binding protein